MNDFESGSPFPKVGWGEFVLKSMNVHQVKNLGDIVSPIVDEEIR